MWLAIFKTGTHTDSQGRTKTWTSDDLDIIAQTYNSQKEHEAPVVIGHPTTDAPAYGWVEKLERRGNTLFAKLKDLAHEFVDWVKSGRYKKVSISLYPNLLLKHVGFLGAAAPAVKGLPQVQFSSSDDDMTYEFADDELLSWLARIFKRLREFLIEKFGLEEADKVLPDYDISSIEEFAEKELTLDEKREAQAKRAKKYGIEPKEGGNLTKPSEYAHLDDDQFADPVNYRYPIDEEHIRAALSYWGMPKNRKQYSDDEVKIITKRILDAAKKFGIEVDEEKWQFSEGEDMAKIEELEQKLKEKEEQLKKLQEELACERAQKRAQEFLNFCDQLISDGKLTPAQKPVVLDFMEILHNVGEFEFVEGETRAKQSALEKFKQFLSTLPKQIEFSEQATKDKVTLAKSSALEFSDKNVDEERLELHKRAMELVESEKLSYVEAVRKVLKTEGGR